LQRNIVPCSSRALIAPVPTYHTCVLRLHGALSEILRRGTTIRSLPHLPSLLEVQAPTDKDDHQRSDDDEADDGVVVAGEVEAEDAVDEADGDDGGAEVEVDFAEEGRGLIALEVGVVDDAEGELNDDAEEDSEADGLVGGVEVWVLNRRGRLGMGGFRDWLWGEGWKYVPCSF
jgi:hypothetical protein